MLILTKSSHKIWSFHLNNLWSIREKSSSEDDLKNHYSSSFSPFIIPYFTRLFTRHSQRKPTNPLMDLPVYQKNRKKQIFNLRKMIVFTFYDGRMRPSLQRKLLQAWWTAHVTSLLESPTSILLQRQKQPISRQKSSSEESLDFVNGIGLPS